MIDLYMLDSVGIDMKQSNNIELNDDGKTTYCDGCEKNEQPAGPEEIDSWTTGILYHATRTDPAEYGQFCPDCSQEPEYEPEMDMMEIDD